MTSQLLAALVVFFAALLAFFVVFPVVFLVAFLAVDAAFLPVACGPGGNHTALVALAFATNEAPRAAHLPLSVALFHRLVNSIIQCSLHVRFTGPRT